MADTIIHVLEGPNAADDADRAELAAAQALSSAGNAADSSASAQSFSETAAAEASAAQIQAGFASGFAATASAAKDDAETAAAAAEGNANASNISAVSAAASAVSAQGSSDQAAANASAAFTQAERAASFVGGNWPLPHSHITGPVAVDPEYTRLSDAYDRLGKRYEYNQRIWDATYGTEVWEGTTNLLPAGSEDFVTGWASYGGETITVTDYPVYIAELGKTVIAKRITGNGAGTIREKYLCNISGVSNPHTSTVSCWAMVLSGTAQISERNEQQVVQIPGTMQIISSTSSNIATTIAGMYLLASAPTNIIDVVLYAPQLEIKATATTYTPPGTTRAAASLTIPVGAYQKNLLTPNQATGGDTLGDTTGFTAYLSTVTRDTTEKWNGTGSIKVVTPGSAANEGVYINPAITISTSKIYTASFWVKGVGTIRVGQSGPANFLPGTFTLTNTWTRYAISFVPITAFTFFTATSGTEAATFYIDGLQLKEGTTASDFALPAVDYTNALIDPAQPFSIEFDAVPWSDNTSVYGYLFGVGAASADRLEVLSNITDGKYRLQVGSNPIASLVTVAAGVKKGHKINVASGIATYALDGVTIGSTAWTAPASLLNKVMYLCANASGSTPRNASFSNVRIRKGVALTAAELAYTGQLVADQYTTFASNLKETTSSRPFVKVNGAGQNVVLAGDSPNQNAIINGDFRLATRGASFTNPATDSILLDGWQLSYNGSGGSKTITQQAATVGQQDIPGTTHFMRIVQTAPSGQTSQYYWTKIEDVLTYNGRKVRLTLNSRSPEKITLPSVMVKQNFGSGGSTEITALNAQNIQTTSNTKKYIFDFTMPSVAGKTIGAGNFVSVFVLHPLNSAFTFDLADVELKPADAPGSYYRRDIQMMQQLRNRYLQALPANLQLRAVNVQTNYIDFESVVLPVEMRAAPALTGTYAETTNWKVLSTAGVQTTGFSLALLNASANQVAFRATKTSHGLTDATLQLVTNTLLSAEL